jgi:hypothetical protein
MHTIEFQATVKDGTIEIPVEHRAEFCDRVQVRLQTINEPAGGRNLIDELLARPRKLKGGGPTAHTRGGCIASDFT